MNGNEEDQCWTWMVGRHQNHSGSQYRAVRLENACHLQSRGHHSVGKSMRVKPGSFLSSQYMLLLTQASSFDFLCGHKKSETVMNTVKYKWVCWNCCYSDKLHSSHAHFPIHDFVGNKPEYVGYLKNLGWCVRLSSSRCRRLSLCSCSILCFCSSAASRFPSSSSLPARHIHYAKMVKQV